MTMGLVIFSPSGNWNALWAGPQRAKRPTAAVRTVKTAVFRGARPVELGMAVTVSMSRDKNEPSRVGIQHEKEIWYLDSRMKSSMGRFDERGKIEGNLCCPCPLPATTALIISGYLQSDLLREAGVSSGW